MGNSKIFEQILKNAYRISGKYVSKHEDRQDLAQIVAMKYYLNKDSVNEDNRNNWIYTTTKHAAIDFLKSKKDISEKAVNFDKLENIITENILNEEIKEDPKEIIKNYEKDLSRPERELLVLYARESFQIKKIAKRKRISYEALKKKIYRLKADIRAKYNLQQGMVGTRKILGAKLNENLLNFFNRFTKAMETNTLDRMSIYFRDCKIPESYPTFSISKVIEYDVRLEDDDKYNIYFTYYDKNNEVKTVITMIQVYNQNSIKVVEFPHFPSQVRVFDINAIPPEVLEKLKYNEKGVLSLSKEELEELFLQHDLIKKDESKSEKN